MITQDKYGELRQLAEKVLGIAVKTPRDFELLSEQIYQRTRQRLSVSTLKRFWGYVDKERDDDKARRSTLDILSQFVGYQEWATFCQADTRLKDESGNMFSRHLFAREQRIGAHIQLTWQPDRQVTIRYEGEDLFTVVESINSKLRPGDTFHCSHIVDGMPLTLIGLVRDGALPVNYVCGRTKGVRFVRG